MTLRKNTLLIIGLTFAGLIVALYAASRIILLDAVTRLEERYTRQNVERALASLSDDLAKLDETAGDWAPWDDTCAFVEGTYDDYVKDNLVDSTFINLRLNLMLFIHSSGRIFFGKAFDLQNEEELTVPESLQGLAAHDFLLQQTNLEGSIAGIVLLPEGPMLIASRPIVSSAYEGPIRGTLIMGRYLDAAEIQRLAEMTQLSLTIDRFDDPQMPPDFQVAYASLSEETPTFVRPLSARSIAGYTTLRDVYGKPVLVLRVDAPREIYEQVQASIFYFVLSLLVAGLVSGIAIMVLLEKRVLARLALINKTVSSIGASGDLSAQVPIAGKDELSSLAGAINRMLESLRASELRLEGRNRDLARRARYLEATANVVQDAASVLEPQELLSRVVALVSERFGFYHTGIFLLDSSGEWAVLQAASSEGGRRMLARGHRLRVGQQGIVGYVTGRGEPHIALEIGADAASFDNPDLADTRSEITLPLRAQGKIIGALDVQSTEPRAFSDEDAAMLQTLADQVATAISNARLFEQAQESLETAQRAYGELSREAWAKMIHAHPGMGYHYDESGVTPLAGRIQSQNECEVDSSEKHAEPGEELPKLAVPVKVRGQVIGVIHVHKPSDAGEWTPEQITLLETLADQLGVALESARLYQDAQRRATRERLTREITDKMRRATDVEGIVQTAVDELFSVLGTSRTFVRLGARASLLTEPAPLDAPGTGAASDREGNVDQ
jgi:sensor domain CHASE-containing protein/GAF domain-containing protein